MGWLKNLGIYAAGVATVPLIFVGYRVWDRDIAPRFHPSYTGRAVSGYVVSENKPTDRFGVYELELRGSDGKQFTLKVDCGREEPVFEGVRGLAKRHEKIIYPGDLVKFEVTDKGEPTILWDLERNSCPVDDD